MSYTISRRETQNWAMLQWRSLELEEVICYRLLSAQQYKALDELTVAIVTHYASETLRSCFMYNPYSFNQFTSSRIGGIQNLFANWCTIIQKGGQTNGQPSFCAWITKPRITTRKRWEILNTRKISLCSDRQLLNSGNTSALWGS